MQQRHIVISGLAVTALFAAIALSSWLFDWLTALLFVVAGVWITYMAALTRRQREDMSRLQSLGRALQDLHKADSYNELKKYMEAALYRVLAGEGTEVKVVDPAVITAGGENMSVWADLLTEAGAAAELKGDSDGNEDRFLLPVKASDGSAGEVIICWTQKHCPQGLSVEHKNSLGIVTAAASLVLSRLSRRRDKEQYMDQLLQTVVKAGEDHLQGFSGHGQRVAVIADLLGRQLGLDEQESRDLHYAALLHDIGRANPTQGIDEDHPFRGAQAFPVGEDWHLIREAIQYHHERYDGSGFPEGRKMTEIPFLARIIAVADIFDGLTVLAPEENLLPPQLACEVIQKSTGSGFDPLIVVALGEIREELEDRLAALAPAVIRDHDITGQD